MRTWCLRSRVAIAQRSKQPGRPAHRDSAVPRPRVALAGASTLTPAPAVLWQGAGVFPEATLVSFWRG